MANLSDLTSILPMGSGLNGSGVPLPEDNFDTQDDPSQRGQYSTPMKGHTRSGGCQGVIKRVNKESHSYDVTIIGAEAPLSDIPRLLQGPGDARLLSVGTRVAVSYDYGAPIILGVLPYTTGRDEVTVNTQATGETVTGAKSGIDNVPSHGYYRLPNVPDDLGPDDNIQLSPDGNFIGALAGGVNLMKSGMAEVRTHLLNDLVEVLCRNYRLTSDMGVSEIKNDNGRVSWTFRGGADQIAETGADQENWTIRLDLGAVGDLFRFELTEPGGGTLFKLHVNSDGKLEIFGVDGIDLTSGADRNDSVLGNREVFVQRDDTQLIQGEQTQAVQGNRTTTVSNSDTHAVGNDLVETIVRNRTESIGGEHQETVTGGNPAVANPANIARKTNILNGSWAIDIGNPLSMASPAALAKFLLNTYTGNIEMGVKVAGNVDFNTLLGNVTMQTTSGIATLKTLLGVANVDGTTINLGPVAVSMTNPLVRGALHSAAFAAYTGTNIGAITPAIAATTALMATVAPPWGAALWPVGPVMASAMSGWLSVMLGTLTALLAANTALAAAVPATLSAKSFTA